MSVRRRLTATLFSGAALGTTAYIAAVTVSGLAVEEITGQAALAGVPSAMGISGTAVGTTLLTLGIARRGRRPGLMGGYLLGSLGAVATVASVVWGSLWLLLAGMAILGFGNASNHLARYTAAEMFPADRRASALSMVVWAGTIGSVLGPILLEPGGRVTTDRGWSDLAGGFLVAIVFMGVAVLLYAVALRPDPAGLSFDGRLTSARPSFGDAFHRPHVQVGLAGMVAGQVVMVLIMVATPLHIRHAGFDLGIVGMVMSAHTLGMFAFSPLTGRVADRFGHYPVVRAGLVLLGISAVLAAVAPADATPLLVFALFLLGLGWNLGFVAGSALLTIEFSPDLRSRLQGRADTITWLSGAVASILSGMVFELTDYRALALVGLALLSIPVAIITRHRRDLAVAPVA